MTASWLGLAWFLLAAAGTSWLAATTVSPALLRRASHPALAPRARKLRLSLVAALPLIAVLLAASAVLVPAIGKPLGLIAHHCAEHGGGHPHICLQHLPVLQLSAWHWFPLALAGLWLMVSVAMLVIRQRRAASQLRSLVALADGRGTMRMLDTTYGVALAADPGRPLILLSAELRRQLDPRQRRIVIAHEAAHLRHGDLFAARVMDWLLVLHTRTLAKDFYSAWRQAMEEHADDAVAARFDRTQVAQTLLRVARMPSFSAGYALRATGGNTGLRIRRLLDPPVEARGRAAFVLIYAFIMVLGWGLLVAAHHRIEGMLGWLV